MGNKHTGTRFEIEFTAMLAARGFWAHRFQDNKNGQPCDVIAARDGEAYLFDCKNCEGDSFRLSRIEENQYNAMKLFEQTGNRRGMFAVRFTAGPIYLVDYEIVRLLMKNGEKRITRSAIGRYGRTLGDWLEEKEMERTKCRS